MLTIQKASRHHTEVLIAFQQLLAKETESVELSIEVVRDGMTALFDDTSKGVYYVAIDGQEVVGCHLITYEWSDWKNGMVWWLQSVYVKESHRKMGVFKKMFDNVMSLINNDPNLMGLRLYVDKSNSKAMNVYASMGMNGSHYTVYELMK